MLEVKMLEVTREVDYCLGIYPPPLRMPVASHHQDDMKHFLGSADLKLNLPFFFGYTPEN